MTHFDDFVVSEQRTHGQIVLCGLHAWFAL